MKRKSTMQLGMIGLGRMGANMVRRLIKGGHQCVVFDRSPDAVKALVKEKAIGATALADLVKKLSNGRLTPAKSQRFGTGGSHRKNGKNDLTFNSTRKVHHGNDGNKAGLLCGFSNKCPSPHYNTLFGPRGSLTRLQPPHLLVI